MTIASPRRGQRVVDRGVNQVAFWILWELGPLTCGSRGAKGWALGSPHPVWGRDLGPRSRLALAACGEEVGAIKDVGALGVEILARSRLALASPACIIPPELVHPRGVDYHQTVQATRFALQTDWISLASPWLVLFALTALVLLLLRQLGGSGRSKTLAGVAILLLGGTAALTVHEQKSLGVELGEDALVLHGLVRASVEKSQVLGHRARVVDLDRQPSFEISRPLGASLGWGQHSGWALLRNGMVVYALVGSGRRWLMVPTQDHYYLALAVEDLAGLQAGLSAWSPSPGASETSSAPGRAQP